jgi:hypothetical protein
MSPMELIHELINLFILFSKENNLSTERRFLLKIIRIKRFLYMEVLQVLLPKVIGTGFQDGDWDTATDLLTSVIQGL